ncbi:aminoacyl-tRNA hydrolase [Azoarcus communis]|uniref:Peptidyl-tRNA hydrolase n=1 Tax=Parazoarcus communis SWub3 = DSM 12120 TaxID=1121029 RepID=A0A323UYA4_9RHOO|nr:aminoacyl-tRNA hydrolase [Parazoarcus communis]NMG47813.1 aminoacyl-tRNA hydrolase [Parazoarcus communis]NMG69569.1 aminoacyl-tRNA hydrolase [Parazoarcus communis SWub3 = DSM 12120]PZA17507.1 aminoacyl-tRNA hydrolase [Azoarcus communis] [Parazoarcus communis SWub3 = DSM 12120]
MTTATPRPPRLVVGLGNPGSEYSETRHNAGFWFCERLADKLGVRFSHESRFHGLVANARDAGVWLLMPQTFMNRSGQAIGALARFYRIEPAEILLVHDELDVPPGQLRLKFGGGLGGHNGLKDTSAHLNTNDYWRLRIGIGHPGDRNEVVNYVLKPARREEQTQIDEAIDRALLAWPTLARGDWNSATQRLNARPAAAKPPKAPKPPRPAADNAGAPGTTKDETQP